MTKTYTPHVHAEVIKAWADGKPIEWRKNPSKDWLLIENSGFLKEHEYRIKPEEVVDYALVYEDGTVTTKFHSSTFDVQRAILPSDYRHRQGFVKRTRIDCKIISFEFISE